MLGVYTILQVNEEGWTSAQTLGLGALALALIAGFVVRQGRIANPLMPLRLFQSRNVSGANLVLGLTVVGMFGMFFLGALYLQLVLGYDPLEVGFAFLPATLIMGTLSLGFTDKINMRFGPRRVVIATLVFLVAGLLLFARAPVDGSYFTDIFPMMILLGLGAGLSFPALIMLAMSGAEPSDAGLASGLINTTAQVGGVARPRLGASVERSACREAHDRDLPVGLLLIARVPGLLAGDPLPRGRAFVACERLWRRTGLSSLDLDLDAVGMLGKVVEPRRVVGRPPARGHDQPRVVSFGEGHDGGRATLAALGADGGQVQQRHTGHLVAGASVHEPRYAHHGATESSARRRLRASRTARGHIDGHAICSSLAPVRPSM